MDHRHHKIRYTKRLFKGFFNDSSLAFTLVLTLFLSTHISALSAVPFVQDDRAQMESQSQSAKAHANLLLKGEVEQYPELEKKIKVLLDIAIERDNDSEFLKLKSSHFNSLKSRALAGAKDIAELVSEYKGFEQSSEAGDIILGEKLKIKNNASAVYAKQLKRDRIETDIFLVLMLMTEGLGSADQAEKEDLLSKGVSSLACLVGESEAQKALQLMRDWICSIDVGTQLAALKPWNSLETAEQTKSVLAKALDRDETIANIKAVVHKKYNRRSSMARASAKILNASLSIAGCTPTIIGTASQCAWTLYIATQGGPEESKLLKEVYLAKSLESRCKSLSDYANLAVNSHNMAIAKHNSRMLSFSEWMLGRFGASESSSKFIASDSMGTNLIEIDSASIAQTENDFQTFDEFDTSGTQVAAVSAPLNQRL